MNGPISPLPPHQPCSPPSSTACGGPLGPKSSNASCDWVVLSGRGEVMPWGPGRPGFSDPCRVCWPSSLQGTHSPTLMPRLGAPKRPYSQASWAGMVFSQRRPLLSLGPALVSFQAQKMSGASAVVSALPLPSAPSGPLPGVALVPPRLHHCPHPRCPLLATGRGTGGQGCADRTTPSLFWAGQPYSRSLPSSCPGQLPWLRIQADGSLREWALAPAALLAMCLVPWSPKTFRGLAVLCWFVQTPDAFHTCVRSACPVLGPAPQAEAGRPVLRTWSLSSRGFPATETQTFSHRIDEPTAACGLPGKGTLAQIRESRGELTGQGQGGGTSQEEEPSYKSGPFLPSMGHALNPGPHSKRFLLILTRGPAPFGGFSKATFSEFSSTSSKVLAPHPLQPPLFYFPSLALRL